MKIRLRRISDFTSSFMDLARVIEGCSTLNATKAIEIAKQVMFTEGGVYEFLIDFDEGTSINKVRKECEVKGAELTILSVDVNR